MNRDKTDVSYLNNFTHKSSDASSESTFWFVLTIMYLMIDLNQIQLIVKPLALIRPGLIVVVLLACYAFFNWPTVRQKMTGQFKLILMFVLLLFVLTPFASNSYRAFMTGRTMLLMLPFLISINVVIHNKQRLIKFIFTIEFILLSLSIYSLSHGGMGPGGMMYDENDLTLFIVVAMPFVFFLYNQSKRVTVKIFHGIIIVCSLLAIVNAFSRGGFLGLVCIFFVFWAFSKKKVLSLLAIALMFGVLYLSGGDTYFDEMKTITDTQDGTANERILSWKAGWFMFYDNPLGVGGSNFPVRFPEYQSEEFSRNMWGRVAHSLWFTLIPELGIFGILIYGALLVKNVKDILLLLNLKKITPLSENNIFFSELGKAFIASFAGFFVVASFISVLYYSHFWYLSCLLATATSFVRKGCQKNN